MDVKLYYCEKGSREPFILLHGNGEDGTYFKHQIDYFSDRYRVIALDTRGHGKSQRGDAPFTIKQFAKDLDGFMPPSTSIGCRQRQGTTRCIG